MEFIMNGRILKDNQQDEYKFDFELGTEEILLESFDIKQKILSQNKLDFLEFKIKNGNPDSQTIQALRVS